MTVKAELDAANPDKIIVDGGFLKKDLIKTLPGSSYKDGVWRVPVSWPMCLALRSTFKNELQIGENLAKWATQWRQERIDPALELREKIDGEGEQWLFPHQRGGVLFLKTAERAMLCDGMGSGKTITAFSTIKQLHVEGKNPFPVLVVCPNSTKFAWKNEIEKVFPGLTVTVINGTAAQRRKQFKEPSHVIIINWEGIAGHSRLAPFGSVAMRRCAEHGGADEKITESKCQVHNKELNEIEFNTVIADEAHRMKDPSSQQSRALKAATGSARFRYALTGTPVANAPDDLFSILNWLYPEAYPSKTKFLDRFVEMSYNSWGAAQAIGIKKSMEQEFFLGFDPIMRRMPKEVILPFLPPIVKQRRDVEMVPKQAKAYKQMAEQMVAELDDGKLITLDPLTKMNRLLQLSASYGEVTFIEKVNPDTGIVERVPKFIMTEPSGMLDAFMDDLDDFDGESVAVFSPSRQLIELLSARLEKKKIQHGKIVGGMDSYERQGQIDAFQAGRLRFCLATSQAGGTGVTLTRARIACSLGRPWSNIESEQQDGRNHRIGSERYDSILHRDYVPKGTVHELVYQSLEQKNYNLQEILRDKELLKKAIMGEL